MKILVTGGGALLGQGIIRALKTSRLNPYLVVVDVNPLSAGLYWGNERYLIPPANSPLFPIRIERLIEKVRPDFVLVGTDVELMHFALNREYLETRYGTRIIVSSPEVVETADDKLKTARFFERHGFEYPVTVDPSDGQALDRMLNTSTFPYIVKPRVGARSVGVSLVHDLEEMRSAIAAVQAPVVQEHIGSDQQEYTASGVYFDGKCDAAIVMRRDLRDGNTYRAYHVDDEYLYRLVREWTNALKPYGPANFQFRIDDNGVAKVFEINARFSGTTPLRAMVGFNEVEMCIRKIAYGEEVIQPAIENYTILRCWSETVISPAESEKLTSI